MHEREEGCWRILMGKPEGMRLLGRPRHRWEDNMRLILRRKDGVLWSGFI
jgi:hypothetical protein